MTSIDERIAQIETTLPSESWHAGRTVGRTLYKGDGPDDMIGIMDTRDLTAFVASAPDAIRWLLAELQRTRAGLRQALVMLRNAERIFHDNGCNFTYTQRQCQHAAEGGCTRAISTLSPLLDGADDSEGTEARESAVEPAGTKADGVLLTREQATQIMCELQYDVEYHSADGKPDANVPALQKLVTVIRAQLEASE